MFSYVDTAEGNRSLTPGTVTVVAIQAAETCADHTCASATSAAAASATAAVADAAATAAADAASSSSRQRTLIADIVVAASASTVMMMDNIHTCRPFVLLVLGCTSCSSIGVDGRRSCSDCHRRQRTVLNFFAQRVSFFRLLFFCLLWPNKKIMEKEKGLLSMTTRTFLKTLIGKVFLFFSCVILLHTFSIYCN